MTTKTEFERIRFRTHSTGKVHRAYVAVRGGRVVTVLPICYPNTGGFVRGMATEAPVTCERCGDAPSFVVDRDELHGTER